MLGVGSWHHMFKRLELGAALGLFDVANVLDVGCGNGRYMVWFSKRIKTVVGLDIDRKCVRKTHALGFPVILGDAHHLPFKDASFELAVSFDVLEHLRDPRQALKEMRRVALKRYVCTPNKLCPIDVSKIRQLFFNHQKPDIERYLSVYEIKGFLTGITGSLTFKLSSFWPLGLLEEIDFKVPNIIVKFMLLMENFLEKLPLKNLAGIISVAY